jgi:hypothetical protein
MTRERRLTSLLIAVLAAVVVIGAGAAFAIGRARSDADGGAGSAAATSSRPAVSSTSSPTATEPSEASHTVSSGITTSSDLPTTSSGLPIASSGLPSAVQVSLSAEAQTAPKASEVQALLQRYFAAINAHDYAGWTSTVTGSQASHWAQGDWERAYASTHDSDIYVSDIVSGAPMSVRIQFVSNQTVDLAPSSLPVTCINWDVSYQLVDSGHGLRVGTSTRNPYLVACR